MKYLYKVRWWMKFYSPYLTWRVASKEKEVFLTFDDGPHPEITPWVLEQLNQYNAKATFFCVGRNVDNHPEVFRQIKKQGSEVGNHTYNHENGWNTPLEKYLTSVNRCESVFGTPFFRPPHGRITHAQIKALRGKFQIIMWSLMCGDFNAKLNPNLMLETLKQNVKKGDIIVFHDSEKAKKNLELVLPEFLKYLQENNFKCSALKSDKAHTFA